MIRKLMFGFTLAAMAGLAIGCTEAKKDEAPKKTADYEQKMKDEAAKRIDQGKDALAKGGEAAKDALAKGKEVVTEGKDALVKKVEEYYPKIEEKIKSLTGDTGTKAKEAFEALKKLVTEFKAAPAEKIQALMGPLTTKFEEVKKMVGL